MWCSIHHKATKCKFRDSFYDGWDEADTWENGATVYVGANTYTGNTPAARVWEITECRGDMNNDGVINNGDSSPYVLALSDPSTYATSYPGLAGSRVWHGDCDTDGSFNNADTPYFVDIVTAGCCEPTYEECFPGDGASPNGGTMPDEVAALFAESIPEVLWDELLAIVSDVAASEDAGIAAFWSDVYALLLE